MAANPRSRSRRRSSVPGFTEEEKAAARERVRELRARSRTGAADGERDVLGKIATMHGSDRVLAEGLHAILKREAPTLAPKTWYGMPAYARDGQVVCYFRPAEKFKTRYATLGFSDEASLDDGRMWPTDFALVELTATEDARITALLKLALRTGPGPE